MLSEEYNATDQTEAKKRRFLSLRVSYTNELADKLNTALHFVLRKIGFEPQQKLIFDNQSGNNLIVSDSEGNRLSIDLQILESNDKIKNIIFHTDDCLRDYHKYILSGVEFISRPEYHAAGLQVNFIDDAENCYTLLEERIYTESD